MMQPNRIFDRYRRSTGGSTGTGSRASQKPPASSTLPHSDTFGVEAELVRPQQRQRHPQHAPHQIGQKSHRLYNNALPPLPPPDPPKGDFHRNRVTQSKEGPPFSSMNVDDMTDSRANSHPSTYPNSADAYFDRSDDPLHRWKEIETTTGNTRRHTMAAHQRCDGVPPSSHNTPKAYVHPSRLKTAPDVIAERPFATKPIPRSSNTYHRHHLPESAIVSPSYDDHDNSSLSSRLSYEQFESAVDAPPFIHQSDDEMNHSNNHYNHHPSAPVTTQHRYNYSDAAAAAAAHHEPLYDHQDRNHKYHHHHQSYDQYKTCHDERLPPTHDHVVAPDVGHRRRCDHEHNMDDARNHRRMETTVAPPPPPRMIEITPGYHLRLRDAAETIRAIQNDYYVPCTCLLCHMTSSSSSPTSYQNDQPEPIFCIQDAEYFLCPHCASVNRLDVDHNTSLYGNKAQSSKNGAFSMVGGVGLGFTVKTLLEVQKDYIINRRT